MELLQFRQLLNRPEQGEQLDPFMNVELSQRVQTVELQDKHDEKEELQV